MKHSRDAVVGALVSSWRAVHGPALFRAISTVLQAVFGATRATLLVHGSCTGGVVVSASDETSARLERGRHDSPATRALLNGDVVIIRDVALAAADDPWCRLAHATGVGSAAGMPLRVGAGTIGAIGLYHPAPNRFRLEMDQRAALLLITAAEALVAELVGRGLTRAIDVDVPQWAATSSRWRGVAAVTPAAEGLAFLRRLAVEQGLAATRSTAACQARRQ